MGEEPRIQDLIDLPAEAPMPIAIWTASLETGNQAVDAQHKRLFQMINELHRGVVENEVQEVLGPVLKRLVAYTLKHFGMEEELMISTHYPHYGRHRPKHLDLAQRVKKLADRYDAGEFETASMVSRLLAEWLTDHIHQEDKELARWMRERDPSI